jgi:hypothetical protein
LCDYRIIASREEKICQTQEKWDDLSSGLPLLFGAAFLHTFGSLDIQKFHDIDFYLVRFWTDFRDIDVFWKVTVL